MKAIRWLVLSLSLVIASAGILLAVYRPKPAAEGNMPNMLTEEVRHPVTLEMHEDAKERRGEPAPDFALGTNDGEKVELAELVKDGPAVVVMTKDGCPCSVESQPYFNDLAKAYEGEVSFVALMDADRNIADLYHSSLSVPYPVATATEDVFKSYRSKQSVYVFLIKPDMTVAHVWPGYSRAMLVEMNQALADAAGVEPAKVDVTKAPEEMTSGCYFFTDDPWVEKRMN